MVIASGYFTLNETPERAYPQAPIPDDSLFLTMKTNKKTATPPVFTHEGAIAKKTSNEASLIRTVMACLLWEDSFYESGVSIADRIKDLVAKCSGKFVMDLAHTARHEMKLRHVPLLLIREMARNKHQRIYCEQALVECIQRADELSEFLAIYWRDGKDQPIPSAVKRGLAKAFLNFTEYDFAKYNRDADIKLRDVMFLVHPKPQDKEQEKLFKKIANNELKQFDTWEDRLSSGEDKKTVFTELLGSGKLGALALLRNLRGMSEAGVLTDVIRDGIEKMKTEFVLPYRFISAAKHAPQFEPELEAAMFRCLEGSENLPGKTLLYIDVSGSMTAKVSGKSEITRIEAGCGLAMLLRELCETLDVYTFAYEIKQVPARRGFALRDAIMSQFGGGTHLGKSLSQKEYGLGYDRLIVISDEQSQDAVGNPKTNGYMLNVAGYQNGVGYGSWINISGWSEQCVKFISEYERTFQDSEQ